MSEEVKALVAELAKYFDSFIFNNLGALTVEGTRPVNLAVAFWDIGGFSRMCNELSNDNATITYLLALLTE